MINKEYLRDWQLEAYNKWVQNNYKGIYESCTGAGKTTAALYCMQEVNVPTLVVVPTIALMNQWREEITNNLGITEIGQLGDGVRDIKRITVGVINTVRETDLSSFEMIILDEAHKYSSQENIKPIMNYSFKYSLGLTATLGKGADRELLELLIGKVVYSYDTKDAVDDGVLSNFTIINVPVTLTELEQQKYDKYTEQIDKNSFQGMFEIANQRGHPKWLQALNAVRATTWRKAVISNSEEKIKKLVEIVKENNGKKIIIFNETIKMAETERKALKKEGLIAEIYHSKAKDQSAIEKFRNGEVMILISVKSLNEGLDVKDVDVGIRVAGTNQERDTIQRLGRSLRVVEGKASAKYYQLYCDDTIEKWQVIKNTNVIKGASDKVVWKNGY